MPLFTLIAEYRGGTYIKQIKAPSPRRAVLTWPRLRHAADVPSDFYRALMRLATELRLESERPIAIDGCAGVWCLSVSYRRNFLLLNVVRTDAAVALKRMRRRQAQIGS